MAMQANNNNKSDKVLWLGKISRSQRQLTFEYGFDDLRFSTSMWYDSGVDLLGLEQKYGTDFMNKIYFHIMAFDANKVVSLKPSRVQVNPEHQKFVSSEFVALWKKLIQHIWGQWRYVHGIKEYVPQFDAHEQCVNIDPTSLISSEDRVVSFCGGGKDSLLAMELLKRSDIPFVTFSYSSSIYGDAKHQHHLCGQLVDATAPQAQQIRMWTYDDFMDSPVLEVSNPSNIKELTAAETPFSIFAVLPVILQYGFRYMSLAHEKSADIGNLIWKENNNEEVNHQWGKSTEAEDFLNAYLQSQFISNFTYFSILKPIYDSNIFGLLQTICPVEGLKKTHSCNIHKPWCKKCPKCAYVFLGYMAYLEDTSMVLSIFDNQNLFDIPANQIHYEMMMGLGQHTPFECIGTIEETKLAFELCLKKNIQGKALDTYVSKARPQTRKEWETILDKYLTVYHEGTKIPEGFAPKVIPIMKESAASWRSKIESLLYQ